MNSTYDEIQEQLLVISLALCLLYLRVNQLLFPADRHVLFNYVLFKSKVNFVLKS